MTDAGIRLAPRVGAIRQNAVAKQSEMGHALAAAPAAAAPSTPATATGAALARLVLHGSPTPRTVAAALIARPVVALSVIPTRCWYGDAHCRCDRRTHCSSRRRGGSLPFDRLLVDVSRCWPCARGSADGCTGSSCATALPGLTPPRRPPPRADFPARGIADVDLIPASAAPAGATHGPRPTLTVQL